VKVALALWLLLPLLYAFSCGPAAYCQRRGWISGPQWHVAYKPLMLIREVSSRPYRQVFIDYLIWWDNLAERHMGVPVVD